METENKSLLDELLILETMVKENPCRMQPYLLTSITASIKGLFNHYLINGASREAVARYFGVDVRTVSRWKAEYLDFPNPGHFGHREISYSWYDIIRWKLKHRDLLSKKKDS